MPQRQKLPAGMGDADDAGCFVPSNPMPPKKRRRTVVSCTECHRRKQKCDREFPCANCRSRSKESDCSYVSGCPRPREQKDRIVKATSGTIRHELSPSAGHKEPLSSTAAAWGYGQTGASTLGFLKRLEMASTPDDQETMTGLTLPDACQSSDVLREKYKSIVRQLPAKHFIDRIVSLFMREFNWQYYFVDPDVFQRQLSEWNTLPFSIFSSEGPHGMSPELRAFPAVLFQMIATALLVVPDEMMEDFSKLKYAANMTFEDLACDYSDSGTELVRLLGKRDLGVTTVQAEFLRASFLKFTAKVTESWHMVAIAIRDAQELGMHRDSLDPTAPGAKLEDVLKNRWAIERRRKMYMVLAIWDINMCLVLGRPGTIDWKRGLPSLPVDAPTSADCCKTPVVARDAEEEPPTPLTRLLWLQTLTGPLRAIQDLEQEGSHPKSFSKVDRLQQTIMEVNEAKPAVFRLENADTRWDHLPELRWIQATRYYTEMLHEFSLMALHRPYVFHRKESRLEALKASFGLLEMQRLMFEDMPSESWRNFMLFFGAFDAIVLIASVYILFPLEHTDSKQSSVTHVRWAIERFATMQSRNPLAKAAQGVLQTILSKLNRAMAMRTPASGGSMSETPSSTTEVSANMTSPDSFKTSADANSNTVSSSSATFVSQAAETDLTWLSTSRWMSTPRPESLASIAPTFAVSDLLFNDLQAANDSPTGAEFVMPAADAAEASIAPDSLTWHFGGEIGNGTLWQILNQFPMGG